MAFDVNQFRQSMIGDGARPNLFEIFITSPVGDISDFIFKAKAAELPGSTVGQVTQYYFGREVKFAGNRTFADWTVTVINDEDFKARNTLELWMNQINSHESNLRLIPQQLYMAEADVTQYAKFGAPIKNYHFVGMFPKDISPIALDWGTNDTFEEFQVTFAYQYWTTDTTS